MPCSRRTGSWWVARRFSGWLVTIRTLAHDVAVVFAVVASRLALRVGTRLLPMTTTAHLAFLAHAVAFREHVPSGGRLGRLVSTPPTLVTMAPVTTTATIVTTAGTSTSIVATARSVPTAGYT